MWLSKYICLFMIYSILGWIYESILCTIKAGKWENRGFLYGPACPIYGTGALAISIIVAKFSENGMELHPIFIFLISLIGSAFLEYATSWALEKAFHAMWWDYSRLPFNLNGRISLFTSIGFGVAGLLVTYIIVPFTEAFVNLIPAIATEFIGVMAIAAFSSDLTLTITALHHFDKLVIRLEDQFNKDMTLIVDETLQKSAHISQELSEKKSEIANFANSLNIFSRGSMLRIRKFSDSSVHKETIREHIAAIAQKTTHAEHVFETDGYKIRHNH